MRDMDGPLRPMEDDIEADYLRIERAGIMDEGYWAAINGLDFEEDDHGKDRPELY